MHVAGAYEGRDGRRSAFFRIAAGLEHDDARDLVLEAVNYSVTVRLALDDDLPGLGEQPLRMPDGIEGLCEAQSAVDLVDEVAVRTAFGPDLSDHVVRRLGVPERAVPGLGDVVAVEAEGAVGVLCPDGDLITPPPLLEPDRPGLR